MVWKVNIFNYINNINKMDIRLASILLLFISLSLASPDGGYPLGRKEYYIDMPIDHFSSGG
jgi:hypothetical protein